MTRLDLLTLKMADDALTADEARELEGLLHDPAARRAHVEMLDLIASLAAREPAAGLREGVMSRILEEISGGIRKNVLEEIRRLPRTTRRLAQRRRPTWVLWALGGLAAAALVVVALRPDRPSPPPAPATKQPPPLVKRPPTPAPEPDPVVALPPEPEPKAPEPPKVGAPAVAPVPPSPPPEIPKPAPSRVEKPAPAPDVPKPPPPPPPPTVAKPAVVARLAELEGEVFQVSDGRRLPLRAGQDLMAGQGLATGERRGSRAVVLLPDGTRVELGPRTELAAIADGLLHLESGRLEARIAKRPDDAPLVFRTPQADARVMGTTLRLSTEAGATVLEVSEGKVRLTRRADGRTVDVAAGQTAVTSATVDPARLPSTGLLGHWRLDEAEGLTARDSSGRQLHGALAGDVKWSAGRHQGGARFGPGGQLSVPDLHVSERFTVAFWVWQPVLTADQDGYVGFGKNGFSMIREGNMGLRQIRLGFSGAPQEFVHGAAAVAPKEWTHVAATCDGQELRLYVNGSPQGSRKLLAPRKGDGGASFGRMGPGGEAHFDDIRVYDRALAPGEIRLVMAGGLALPSGKR